MTLSEHADMDLEKCKVIHPFLALFPSVTVSPFLSSNNREIISYLSNGVLLFDALSDLAPSYFDSSSITREPKNNYILKQSNIRKLLRNLQTYLRVEREKMICFPNENLQEFIINIAKDQFWNNILFLLELVTAIAVTSDQRTIFVGRVREMPTSHQLILKDLIQQGLTHLQDCHIHDDIIDYESQQEGEEEVETAHDANDSSNTSVSVHPFQHHRSHSIDSEFEITETIVDEASINCPVLVEGPSLSSFLDITHRDEPKEYIQQLEDKFAHLRELYANMEKEMTRQQQRENELCSKLSEISARHKADLMQAESMVIARERQLSEDYEVKMADLERALKNAQASAVESYDYKQQVYALKDELDVLKHAREKAIQCEEHVQRLKEKLESLQDVNECLKREENAHSQTIEKCLRLENEIASLLPLRRQLEDYKNRLVEVEIKLAEHEQENTTWSRKYDLLCRENATLMRGSSQLKEEELSLRRQLASGPNDYLCTANGIGVGVTELNPELKAELTRLRKENEQLKDFASKRENDHVKKMEDKIEDLNRLSQKLKEQYLQNKRALEESIEREKEKHLQLTDTLCREEALKTELITLQLQYELEKKTLIQEGIQAKTKLEEEFLSRLSSEQHRFQAQIEEITREKNEIEQYTLAALRDSEQQHESDLEKLRIQHQQKIDTILKNNEDDRTSLMEKGKQHIKKQSSEYKLKIQEMELKCQNVEEKCEEKLASMKRKMDAFEKEAKTKFAITEKACQSSLQTQRILKEKCEELEEECHLLKREKSNIENELDRQRRRRMGADSGQGYLQYENLQREIKTVLNENRQLKGQLQDQKRSQDLSQSALKPSTKQNLWADTLATSTLSFAELRSDYEDRISHLTDEKRELIMKNAAVMAEAKRAQQQAWDLEEQVSRLNNELTSVTLKLERATGTDSS